MKVSVIVPVYKVERFITKCAESLFAQTLDEVEFIFVDDASPDKSIELLKACMERYPERKGQIQILSHETNKGLPAARNMGLSVASGEYVFHCDSDDFMEPDTLAILYEEAKRQDADIVWCDWYLTFQKNERYMKQPCYSTPGEALRGMLGDKMKYNVWNKLSKRRLYTDNEITFPEGYGMGEDMTMIRLMACAERVAYVPKALYHYVKTNTGAFTTSRFSDKQLTDVIHNTAETCRFIRQRFPNQLEEELACFQLMVKYPWLISSDTKSYDLWRAHFRESDAYVNSKLLGRRCRLLQQAALRHFDVVLKLHYWLIYKVVYGILYR